jgi:glutamyl-tRNA(Gln) amidotransferase subunit E
MGEVDYKALGFKCGLEIHQQLATQKKLFCHCPAVLRRDEPDGEILRHMRPTLSELGEYDGTALMEFKTKKNVIYQLYRDTVCTYEMDDTPPFEINQNALDIVLEISLLLNCSIVDEIHISRKQYLDGSIPTGFQRTAIVGVEGVIPYKNRKIGIIQVALEEDACREVCDVGHTITFKTDRLSIPLVEVVTHAHMKDPKEVVEVAQKIGRLLRATGKVRRGSGSVRQDINVSITGGERVEIKGVQKLQHIEKLVHIEALRQKALLGIKEELKKRGIAKETLCTKEKEITNLFKNTNCGMLRKAIENGDVIRGIKLEGFGEILNWIVQPNISFAQEFSGRVRVIACLDNPINIMHSDNLLKHGITVNERERLMRSFEAKHEDVVVMVWGNEEDTRTAIEEIELRAIDATIGVPNETRQAFPNGSTTFERILPGPDRMYPDTDLPSTPVTQRRLKEIKKFMPEFPWVREAMYIKLGVPKHLARSLAISKRAELFDKIVEQLKIKPMIVASAFEEDFKRLRRKGCNVDLLSDDQIYRVFQLMAKEEIAKESLPIIFEYLANNRDKNAGDAVKKLDIHPLGIGELHKIVEGITTSHSNPRTFRQIMGDVMGKVRGRIDGKIVSEVVEQCLKG